MDVYYVDASFGVLDLFRGFCRDCYWFVSPRMG